jgi:hypothetical protein
MRRAQQAVMKGDYETARRILVRCQHPKAADWLALVDGLEQPIRRQPRQE